MPILDIQKRSRELGRIRLGAKQPFTRRDGSTGTKPVKLDRFRLTSASEPLLTKVAELYGGEVAEWTPDGGSQQWEVITDSRRLPILVPNQPVSQWYEFWTRAGCQHRCDGQTNVLTDEPCDLNEKVQVGKAVVNPHEEALKKPTTRLNVVLRDVEGIGVWRVETHGWNAALELPDVAEFLAQAGGYVEGWLALEQRTSIEQTDQGPKTHHYAVPIIEIGVTPAELLAGGGRVQAPALGAGGPVPAAAIEAPATQEQPAAAAGPQVTIPTPEQIAAADLATVGRMVAYLQQHLPADHPAIAAAQARAEQLVNAAVPDADGAYEAEIVEDPPTAPAAAPAGDEPNPEAVWQQIVAHSGTLGWDLNRLRADFTSSMGMDAGEASGFELQAYLTQMTTGEPVAL